MTDDCTFDTLYAGAPPALADELRAFRAAHPPRAIQHGGLTWDYLSAGHGAQTILWLVGGLKAADAAFRSIPLLADSFRIVAPSYPPARTLAALADGLAAVLDAEGVAQAHILSGSFGGMLAQVFVRRYPARVDRLILSNTTVVDSGAAAGYRQQRDALAALPAETVAAWAETWFYDTIAPPDSESDFWRAYLHELFTCRLGPDDLTSTLDCLLDMAERDTFTPDDLRGWPGRILILESDDDATFDAAQRAQVRARYPGAQIHTFSGAGHSPATTQRDAFFAVVRAFLTAS